MAGLAALLAVPLLALLLLAAHFVHAGLWPVAIVCLAAVALLWVRRPWSARALQLLFALGTIEWVLTAATRAQMRISHQQPYVRLVVILGACAVFTALAALLLQHPRLAARFGLRRDDARSSANTTESA